MYHSIFLFYYQYSSLFAISRNCSFQKLARSRRGGGGRAWFPGNWQSGTKSRRHYDSEDVTDVDELPIELRRVETTHALIASKHTDTLSIKSKSLGDIMEVERLDLVRSRSSIPGFCSTSELILDERSVSSSSSGSKPRLVKQKSCVEETGLENPEDTAIENLIKDLPDFPCQQLRCKRNVLKQSSMNEELMSVERLKEKEQVRRNIMKQTSLNEELICKWRTFEAFKDTISPVNAGRRFQLLKDGLTSKIKRSTTNIEKVSSISIKNGFVRMLQGWKSSENETSIATEAATKPKPAQDKVQPPATVMKRSIEGVERRLSREDGSDSSKDSSLQSDTSVDSEDSFASVIFVPKQDAPTPAAPMVNEVTPSPRPAALQLGTTSAPPSPRVKQPPDDQSSRFKLIGVLPLLKQQQRQTSTTHVSDTNKTTAPTAGNKDNASAGILQTSTTSLDSITEPAEQNDLDTTPLIRAFNDVTKIIGREPIGEDENRDASLNQIKEMLTRKPGFATRDKPFFPLIKSGCSYPDRPEAITRILPRLLSLELFNPETDDLDSDSSGVSSPESVGSVISVTSDERYIARKEAEGKKNNARANLEGSSKSNENSDAVALGKTEREVEIIRSDESLSLATAMILADTKIFLDPPRNYSPAVLENKTTCDSLSTISQFSTEEEDTTSIADVEITRGVSQDILESDTICPASPIFPESERISQSMRLLEAAANVASSLEDAVETAIQSNTQFESRTSTRACLKQDRKSASLDLGNYESYGDRKRDINRYCQNSSFDLLNVCQASRTMSSSPDIADDNSTDTESTVTAACWEECNGLPKETTWIVNEAYKSGCGKLADTVQSELKLKSETEIGNPFRYKSKSLCEDQCESRTEFEQSDIESKCEIKLESEVEAKTGFSFKYDEIFKLNLKSEDKSKTNSDLVSIRLKSKANGNLTSDVERSIIKPKDEYKPSPEILESNFQFGSELEPNPHARPQRCSSNVSPLLRSNSDDTLDFAMVSKTSEFEREGATEESVSVGKWRSQGGLSMGSSGVADSTENTTTSPSDGSQAESTARLFTGSTMSLVSNVENSRCTVERRRLQERGRSLDEITSEAKRKQAATDCLVTTTDTLSNASSQESLPSDRGGGAITYHQYYHVFREGELDQLINKYVENLHIISSYYDHSSWCVVAEKVQVWTI